MKSNYCEVFTKTQPRPFFTGMRDECVNYVESQRKVWTNATFRIEKNGKVLKTYSPLRGTDYSKRKKKGELSEKEFNAIVSSVWELQERYETTFPMSRWQALRSFWFGRVKIQWSVPASQKDKTITLKGKRIW